MTIDATKYLSPEEMTSLREKTRHGAANGLPQACLEWLLVDLATQTGLRVSELARLTVGDVDLRHGALRVTRSKKRKACPPELLPVSPSLTEHLRSHLAWLGTCVPQTSLWSGGQRGAWGKRGLQQAWVRVCAAAGFPSYIHQARHTLAVELLKTAPNPGQALRLVQKQLGHEKAETTAKMYADVPWSDRVGALERLFG